MKAEYKRECTGNVLVLEDEYGYSFENYQIRMLTGNQIPTLLECRAQMVDTVLFFHYDTLDYQPLSEKYARKGMQYRDMEKLLLAIDRVMKAVSEYLLSPAGIVLEPEYIFADAEGTYHFCYLPGRTLSFAEIFRGLSEYILDHMDYGEKEGVVLGYGIYRKSQEPQACMDSLNALLHVSVDVLQKERMQESLTAPAERNGEMPEDYELWDGNRWEKQEMYKEMATLPENGSSRKKADGKKKNTQPKEKRKWLRTAAVLLLLVVSGGAALFRAYALTDAGTEIKIEAASSEPTVSFAAVYGPRIALVVFSLGLLVLFARIFRKKRKNPGKEEVQPLKPVEPTRYLGDRSGEIPHKLIQMDTQEEKLLSGNYMKIGKDQLQVDVWIQAETVSRLHAAIFREGGDWHVQDLASTNGTFLNGRRLQGEESPVLTQGDELMFADQAFLFL